MATSIITVTVFSGTNEDEPPCYLLQVDNFHCLLDCGWDSNFSNGYIQQVARHVKKIDAVLLSHSDIFHLGALPYLIGKCGLSCPIYATHPVSKMGHLTLYDALQSKEVNEKFDKFTLDDVDEAFDLIVPVKYQETKNLHGKVQGVSVTPFLSGHMLGGAIWKIIKDDIEIVYAVDYNLKKELHLNGANLDNIQRPHLLITSSYGSIEKLQRSKREEHLKKIIYSTLRNNGNVLILTDTGGRSLEIAYLLEQLWYNQESGLMAYGLVFLNRFASNIMDHAKSYVEWMSEKINKSLESEKAKPFEFRYTRTCHTLADLNSVPDPKVVVVSQPHLNYGFGRDLLMKWCNDKRNQIILTSRAREKCIASELFDNIMKRRSGVPIVDLEPLVLSVTEKVRVPGTTIDTSSTLKLATPDLLLSSVPSLSRLQTVIETANDESSSDEDDPIKMDWQPVSALSGGVGVGGMSFDFSQKLSVDGVGGSSGPPEVIGQQCRSFDIYAGQHSHSGGQFFRATKRLNLVYPSQEGKIQWDDYGEPIDVKDPSLLQTPGSAYAISRAMNDAVASTATGDYPMVVMARENSIISSSKREVKIDSLLPDDLRQVLSVTDSSNFVTKDVPVSVTVSSQLAYVEYEGLSEGANMQHRVYQLKPQEIIVVGGCPEASKAMATYYRTHLGLDDRFVHLPVGSVVVNCTREGQIYQARMSDGLVSSLNYYRIGSYELSWLESIIRVQNNGGNNVDSNGEMMIDETMNSELPSLEPPEGSIPEHSTIFINEPKLSDLKQTLISEGMNAEFVSGMLIVDNCVAIKRSKAGKLKLEGAFGKKYFDVRRILYSQFAIL